jgi:hypothetical protein
VTHERRELIELPGRIRAVAVPAQQTPDGERMPQIVQAWRRDSVGNGESEGPDQRMEDLASGARMNAAATVEGEQRCGGVGFWKGDAAPFDLGAHQFSDAGAVGHEAALAELAASHHQQVAISINIAQAEAADLSGAQTEPIAETEDGISAAKPGTSLARRP